MIDWLWQLDLATIRLINTTWANPVFDALMFYVSDVDTMWPVLVLLVLGVLWLGKWDGRLLIITMAFMLVLGDAGTNWAFKRNVNRPRPHESVDGLRRVSREGISETKAVPVERGRSFTSGHACNNWSLALTATAVYGLGAVWWLWPWAVLIGYSRIYTADHFPSDVLGSWLVATVYTLLILRGLQWAWDFWGPSAAPTLYKARPRLYTWGAGSAAKS